MLHACTSPHAILSAFMMLCTNSEWAVIAPGGNFFLFSEKSAWFSAKNTAANSDDFNVCIRVVHNTQA